MGGTHISTTTENHIPGIFGEDLPEEERSAYQKGLDADNLPKTPVDGSLAKELGEDADKEGSNDVDASSILSEEVGVPRDLEKGLQPTTTEEQPSDPNLVDWEGPDDPQNPMNWSSTKKWGNIAILSFMTLLTPLASSMFAPAVPAVLKEFNTDNDLLATWVVSVYILGFAMGPLVVAPFSEMYGRVPVYNVCNVVFTLFTIACALARSLDELIVFRFFAGCFGIAPITNGGGSIADIMPPERRGAAMSVWALGPLLGPVIGPICGGFLSQAEGWRWIFWVLSIFMGVGAILMFLITRETYGPVLLERKARRLREETGNMELRSKLDNGQTAKTLWKFAFLRPAKLMFMSLICGTMSLYMAIVYGILYLLFSTFTFVFEDNYGFSQSTVGLVYIGVGVGMLVGVVVLGSTSDRLVQHMADKHNNGVFKPEYRLPFLMYACVLIPIGLFWYGWSAQYHVQWAVPLVGTLFLGFGILIAFMCINTYLIDTFTLYAASAMAANTILRSILGAVFPLFALEMYARLGLGWGNSLLGFLALAMCAMPWIFYYYGERIRNHPKLQVKL